MEPIHSPSLGLVTCKKKKVHRGRARPAVLIAHCAPSENSEAAFILCFVTMRKRHPTGRSQGFTFVPKARLKRVFVFTRHAYVFNLRPVLAGGLLHILVFLPVLSSTLCRPHLAR